VAFKGLRSVLKASILAAVMATAVVAPTAADTINCLRVTEVEPLKVRLFQTELMVAALTCKRRTDYNQVIAKFGDELAARGRTLKVIFKRLYGTDAEPALNRFVTRLANEASLRSLRTADYCNGVGALFSKTLQLQPHMLAGFVANQTFSDNHGFGVCKPREQLSASR
jgi:hypothetical protein